MPSPLDAPLLMAQPVFMLGACLIAVALHLHLQWSSSVSDVLLIPSPSIALLKLA